MAIALIATFVLGGVALYVTGARLIHRPSADGAVSIAVLPFNGGGNPGGEYFSDGFTEQLIDALSHAEGLRVTPRATAFQYKGKALHVEEIGRKLDIGAIVEGSASQSGGRMRITVQVINTVNRHHLWSRAYDRETKDVFAVEDEIAHAVVKALRVPLHTRGGRPLVRQYTENLQAYDFYLKGLYQRSRNSRDGVDRAIENFDEAIRVDAHYAPAYAALASVYPVIDHYGESPSLEAAAKLKRAAEKALELDDSLAEAHTALAYVKAIHDWDWTGAEREFRRAIELDPGSASAHATYALACLIPTARLAEAAVEAQKAAELDPFDWIGHLAVAQAAMAGRRYDNAITAYRRTLDLNQNLQDTPRDLEMALAIRQGPAKTTALAADGWRPIDQARRSSMLGRADDAFPWLEKALAAHDPQAISLKTDPRFDNIRRDTRWAGYLKRMGL